MKPFNLEHAAAGAPVRLSDGTESVRIICTDREHVAPVVALVRGTGGDYIREFYEDGTPVSPLSSSVCPPNTFTAKEPTRLVMTPIGVLEGREVYWGDELEHRTVGRVTANTSTLLDACTWPRMYPVTQMTYGEMTAAWAAPGDPVPPFNQTWGESYERIANAAIRHGIDNGYLRAGGDHD